MRVAVALLVLLLSAPLATPASPAPSVAFALAPSLAPADGTPFAVVVEARAAAGSDVEAKVWVGTPTTVLSHTFDGLAWVHSSRYAARGVADADGRWRGALAVSVEATAGNLSLLARVRVGDATSDIVETPLRLLARDALLARWSTDTLAVARSGSEVALGTTAPSREGATTPRARVLAPAGFVVANATAPPAARLLSAGAGEAEVEAEAATSVCLRQREVACRDVPAGRSRLPLPAASPVTLVVWGEDVETVDPPDKGVLRREGDAWVVRPEGFTLQPPAPVENARVFAFTYPESGLWAFERVAGGAERTLDAWVYELTSEDAAARLADAAGRGVRVRLLLEGAPVGGIETEEARLLSALASSGVEVRTLKSNGTFPARFPNVHAKVLVADREVALVGSENWNAGAMGLRGDEGNRGWGVVAEAPATSAWLADAFAHDWAGRDAVRWEASGGARPLPSVGAPTFRGIEASSARIVAVLAPDDARAHILSLLAQATRTIDVQELFVQTTWDDSSSPLVDALLSAAARGVRVRLHLDGSVRTEADLVAAEILARARGLPVEVRVDASGRTIHNKGIVVDSERALVSSINWGKTSVTANREAGIVVEDARVGSWFGQRFEEDWERRAAPAATGFPPLPTPLPSLLAVVAVALGLVWVLGQRK